MWREEKQETMYKVLNPAQTEGCIFGVCCMAATHLSLTVVSTWRGFASASGKRRLLFGVMTTA